MHDTAAHAEPRAKRILIQGDPFEDPALPWTRRGRWPSRWVSHRKMHDGQPCVVAYRLRFTVPGQRILRVHVTADERYELYLDGQRIGWGSERGDLDNWYFETYDLSLSGGDHVLVARTWWLGANGPAPVAQMGTRPAFLLAAEGEDHEQFSTGSGLWECRELPGLELLPPEMTYETGAKLRIRGSEYAWDFASGAGEGWGTPFVLVQPVGPWAARNHRAPWTLAPATLPPMVDQQVQIGRARHVEPVQSEQTRLLPVQSANHRPDEAAAWNALLRGEASVTIGPRMRRRVIIDLEDYYTAFPQLLLSGGSGSAVRLHWAEALYEDLTLQERGYRANQKGNRNEIEGKCFWGIGDLYESDGARQRLFEPLWWQAGRYLECYVETDHEPLVIEQLRFRQTHYPLRWEDAFESSDPRLERIVPVMRRALLACAHETYMDCPYYEQLMYVGDTRLEALATYVSMLDDRLPRKAIRLFDASRSPDGLTQSRYPSRLPQIIPPFSLWWIAMVHDYARWRDDPQFVRERMPGVRAVLEGYRRFVNGDGLVERPRGWNYMDWAPGWWWGIPPGEQSVSAILNYQLALVLRQAAELERLVAEPQLAARNDALATRLAEAADALFWNEARGLYADDPGHESFSEHAQCLALLGNSVPQGRRDRVADGLLNATDLHRATIYFSHYLFEALGLLRRVEAMWPRLQLWFDHPNRGLRTTMEQPEPSRSDCHAWGAHPLYHFYATFLGIRPAAPGFRQVRIDPQLGPLSWARGQLPHPRGMIRVELHRHNGTVTGTIELPEGIAGILRTADGERPLKAGRQKV